MQTMGASTPALVEERGGEDGSVSCIMAAVALLAHTQWGLAILSPAAQIKSPYQQMSTNLLYAPVRGSLVAPTGLKEPLLSIVV